MNVRKRSGLMKGAVGSQPTNTVTKRRDAVSQAKPITNTVSPVSAAGPSTIRNAVNGPK